jgi:ubiquinone biosynthesis protein
MQGVFLKMCFDDGFVHADLHPGNLLLLENGDLAIFDVGLVKHLREDVLLQTVDFTKCLVMGSPRDFVAHLRRFHAYRTDVEWAQLEKDVEGFLAHFRRQNVAELELGALINEILALGRRYRVRPVADFALVMVAMVTAEGLGKQLNPEANLFRDTAAFLGPVLARRGLSLASAT